MNKSLADYYMEKYRLGAIIATQPISLKYFCGFDCWFTNWIQEWMGKPGGSNCSIPLFCILPYKDDPILMIPSVIAPFAVHTFSKEARFFGGIPPVPKLKNLNINKSILDEFDKKQLKILEGKIYPDPIIAVEETIKEKDLSDSNIGFELDGFNSNIFSKISDRLKDCSFKDCTEIIRLIRMIKTDEEISLLTKSAELNELAMNESAKYIKENNNFGEAFNKFRNIVQKKGGIVEHYIFSSYGCGVSDNKDYHFKKDQFILLDTGAYYSNYISDTGTTVFLGNKNQKYLDIFKRIYEGINMGLSSLKPGVRCSTVNDNMIKYLEKYNILKTDTHGHGIGLQPSEYPVISSKLDYVYNNGFEEQSANFSLEENMVVALEIPYYIYGEGSYIIEVSAIVTKSGYKSLTTQNRENPIINY